MAIMERPAGITALVIRQVIGGIPLLIGGLGMLFLSAFITGFLTVGIPAPVPGLVFGFLAIVAEIMVTIDRIDRSARDGRGSSP